MWWSPGTKSPPCRRHCLSHRRTRAGSPPRSLPHARACVPPPTARQFRERANGARQRRRRDLHAMPRAGSTALLRSGAARSNGTNVASTAANVRPPAAVPTGRAEARRAPGQRQTGRLRVSAIHRARRTVVRCRRALLAPQSTLAGDPRHGALQSRHDLRGGGPLDLAGHEACRGSDRLRCCPALAAPCCTRDGWGRRCDLERTRRIRLFGGHKERFVAGVVAR